MAISPILEKKFGKQNFYYFKRHFVWNPIRISDLDVKVLQSKDVTGRNRQSNI
jgi:hypothetical protein